MYQLLGVSKVCSGGEASFTVSKDGSEILHRTYHDFKRLSAEVERLGVIALPLKRLKNLCESDWVLEGEGWNHHMIKSVKIVNQWLASAVAAAPQSAFFHEESYAQATLQRKNQSETEKHARRYQQYFMSEENMNRMVQLASLLPLHDTIILEPSCGDGRLLQLLSTLGDRIIGCDIDIVALTKARVNTANNPKIMTLHSDFLLTTKEDFLTSSTSSKLIAIGGPPYTAGGGTGHVEKTTGRELPYQFISHCAKELQCTVILFLLPVRFCKAEAIAQVVEEIGSIEVIENEFDSDAISVSVDAKWSLRLLRPVNDRFDFVERSVVQPVVFYHLARKA